MAIRGRKPKPEAIKALTGRSHKKKEPPLTVLAIDAQQESDYEVMPTFAQLWDNLSKAGVAKMSDRLAFARLCELYEMYAAAVYDVRARGMILRKGTVDERYNPSWRIMRDAHQEILKLEIEFGLTPSSKRRIMQPIDVKADEGGDGYAETRRQQREARKGKGA